ncbi:hypothetical protein ACTHRH_12205 [Paenibacillus sp. SAFN-117]
MGFAWQESACQAGNYKGTAGKETLFPGHPGTACLRVTGLLPML